MPEPAETIKLIEFRHKAATLAPLCRPPKGEIRDTGLGNIILSCDVAILFRRMLSAVQDANQEALVLSRVGYTGPDSRNVVREMIRFVDRGFMADALFQLEHMLCLLADRAVKPLQRKHDDVSRAVESLLRVVRPGISGRTIKRRLLPFEVAKRIRNTLHNNGVHNRKRYVATIGPHTFRFLKGRTLSFGFLSFLFCFDLILDVIREILEVPQIKRLKVMDPFARGIGVALQELNAQLDAGAVQMQALFASARRRGTAH